MDLLGQCVRVSSNPLVATVLPGNHGLGATVSQAGSAQKEVERQEGSGALATETSREGHVTWLTQGEAWKNPR